MIEPYLPSISDLISTIGIGLTVYFAWGAKNAADAAHNASNQTRLRLGKIEAADLIRDCIFSSKTTIEKIEAESWDLASHNATQTRRGLVSLNSNSEGILEAEHAEAINEAIYQFRTLTEQIDKVRMSDWKAYKRTNFVATIHEQIDALIAIQEHIRKRLGEEA